MSHRAPFVTAILALVVAYSASGAPAEAPVREGESAGTVPTIAVSVLVSRLSSDDPLVVRSSLAEIASRGSDATPALPALVPLLDHDESDIRWATLTTLGAIGPPARGLLPSIERFLTDDAIELRLAAAATIQRIEPPATLPRERLAEYTAWLDEHIPQLMHERHVPGVSIAIVQRGVVWSRGFGVRDVRGGAPVTTDTVFEACSMSKPILALVAMQLVQEGRLDLDRPLVDYLGHDYVPDQAEHRRITARMALTHRTGLPNWRIGYEEGGGPLSLTHPPGTEYTYSGEGIVFLQRAIEAIAGAGLEPLVRERLFAPLGLERTSFVWSEALERDLASGHRVDGSYKDRTRYASANGAYSLYTTPTEYAMLMQTLLMPEVLGTRAYTRYSIDRMLQRELRVPDDERVGRPGRAQSVAKYRALGWSLDVTPQGDIAGHSGSNSSGFKVFGQFSLARQSALVVFTNGDSGGGVWEAIVGQIGDL